MSRCQAEDCPAPKIEYEKLNSLSGSLFVCPFCFTRLNVSEKNYNKIKMIDSPSQGFTRIPPTKKDFLESKNIDKHGSIILKSPKSKIEELYEWDNLLQSLKDSIEFKSEKIKSVSVIDSELKPILLNLENQSIILFLRKKGNSLIDPLEDLLFTFFPLSIRDPIKINLEKFPEIGQNLVMKTWDFIEKKSSAEYIVYFFVLQKNIIPMKELIDHPEYSKVNLSILIRELSIIWILLMVGYDNILDSLVMEFNQESSDFAVIFLGNENFSKCDISELEKKIFQDFALFLPFILDDFAIFREEALRLKSEIKRKLIEPDFKLIIDQFFPDENFEFPIFEY
ncbi:MAG: hypothetical protein HeimC3_28290 [Candidatus Heimdallarchaeota archaeon LC_3]|nr:MAG: hypothetical protein HeimC3_28290 [Candidatus Heimdallarchaeota archaeon LC_3]